MKIVVWSVFVLLALLWTGGAAVVAALVEWAAAAMANGGATAIGTATASVTLPAWLAPWIDVAAWESLQQAVSGMLASMTAAAPTLGGVVSWLVPLVWIVWGLGMVGLLLLTLLLSWGLGKLLGGGRPVAHAA